MFNKVQLKSVIEDSKNLSGVYNGTVVSTKDDGYKKNGNPISRVKVSIPDLTEGIPVDLLPWYVVKQTFSSAPNTQINIPPLGSEVIVEFPNNDIYNGVCSYVLVSSPP